MNGLVKLNNQSENNQKLEALFSCNYGMNLISFKKDDTEIIDQSTKPLFTERCAGLGALIGPHFHHRPSNKIPHNYDITLFPHIKGNLEKGIKEPFSHGIARYVPWKYKESLTQIDAMLSGNDFYKSTFIKELEGFNFEMHLNIKLVHDGLILDYRCESETPSVIGFHYYFNCDTSSKIKAHVKSIYRDGLNYKSIPDTWLGQTQDHIHLSTQGSLDFGFQSQRDKDKSMNLVILENQSYDLHIEYISSNENESSFQIYHPKESSFVCIEPLSSFSPNSPIYKTNHLQMKLSVYKK
jgi:hypothetical protein